MIHGPRALLRRFLAPQTRGFARDSLKLSAASAVVVGGYGLQIALITHILGLDEFGVFAVVVAFVDLVARLLDFQVGQMTTTFAASSLQSNPRRVVGIAQFSYLIDTGAGLVGFGVISALAAFAAAHLLDGEYSAWLFVLYGLTVLVTTTESTSIALLQVTGEYTKILRLTLVREVLRAGFVVLALVAFGSLAAVIVALVAMEACLAVLWTAAASRAVRGVQVDGGGLWQPSLVETNGLRRPMARMVFHTNVISYVKIAAAQGPTLLLGAMRPPADAGAFKVGMAIAAVVGKPSDPAWAAILPRLARLVDAGRRSEITSLIRQSALGVCLAISSLGLVAIVLRDPLLRLVGGQQALVAGSVLVLGVLARIVNGTLFWNSPLLYALRRAGTASAVFVGTSLVFVPVLVVCIDRWGATGAALALLFWNVVVNLGLTIGAVSALRDVSPATTAPPPAPAG